MITIILILMIHYDFVPISFVLFFLNRSLMCTTYEHIFLNRLCVFLLGVCFYKMEERGKLKQNDLINNKFY